MAGQFSQAVRRLARTPTFFSTAVLTIAVGVGLTATVFCVIQTTLLRPLPYAQPDRLVRISEDHSNGNAPMAGALLSSLTYHAWRQSQQTLEDLALYTRRQYRIAFEDEPTREYGAAVSPAFFGLLRQTPAAGRFFRESDGETGADQVVVLSHALWRERFGARLDVIGRAIPIDGRSCTIVGVASPGFQFPGDDVMLWTPLVAPPFRRDADAAVTVSSAIGRLKPDVTPAQAAAEGTAIARGLGPRPARSEMLLGTGGPVVVDVETLQDTMMAPVRPILLVFATSVACLCLLAIANAANLFLARALGRRDELAVRAALGASSRQITASLVTENLVLSAFGGAAGLVMSWTLLREFPKLAPQDFPRVHDIALDGATIGFAMFASIATAILCSLPLTIWGRRVQPFGVLRDAQTMTRAAGGAATNRLRAALLVAQTGLAVVVIVAAVVFGRDLFKLTRVDAGYSPANVLTASVFLPGAAAAPERTTQFLEALLSRVRAMPGVIAAGAGNMMPFAESTYFTSFELIGSPGGPITARPIEYSITPGYAEAVGLRLQQGRLPTETDAGGALAAVLINQEFSRQFLRNGPVVGRTFPTGLGSHDGPSEIVGVVGNVLKDGPASRPHPEVYLLTAQGRPIRRELYVVIKTSGDASPLMPTVRTMIREADRTAVIYRVAPLASLRNASIAQPRFSTLVLIAFAALAVVLTTVGVYGSLSYYLSQRSREYALRAALGAERCRLVRLALWHGVSPAMLGLATGIVASTALLPLTRAYLFDGGSAGILPLVVAALVVVPVAVAASIVPALRFARVDPAQLLKGS